MGITFAEWSDKGTASLLLSSGPPFCYEDVLHETVPVKTGGRGQEGLWVEVCMIARLSSAQTY